MGKAHAKESDSVPQPYSVEDGQGGPVDYVGVIGIGRQRGLLCEGMEIGVPDGEGDFSSSVSMLSRPSPYHLAELKDIHLDLLPLVNIPGKGHTVAYGLRFLFVYNQGPLAYPHAHGL